MLIVFFVGNYHKIRTLESITLTQLLLFSYPSLTHLLLR